VIAFIKILDFKGAVTVTKTLNEWIKQKAFNQISDHFSACLESVKKVAESGNDEDVKLREFRKDLGPVLDDLKAAAEAIAKAGYMEGYSQLADLQNEMVSIAVLVENESAKDVLIGEISRRFAISEAFNRQCRAKGHATRLAVFRDMLLQESNPEDLARREIGPMPEPIFLPALLVGFECSMPPFKSMEPEKFTSLLVELERFLCTDTETRVQLAVEYLAAHMKTFRSGLEALLEGTAAMKSPASQAVVEDQTALRPHLLAGLYALTQDPVLLRVAELAVKSPSGELPYAYLERMGVTRSAEWHFEVQGKAKDDKRIALYEFALMTPGYEINPDIKLPLQPFEVKEFITLLKSEAGEGPEGVRKRQELFDLMANLCGKNDPGQQIRSLLVKSDLPKELFKGHLNLLGDSFGRDLGI
jgi:hypothetical protein